GRGQLRVPGSRGEGRAQGLTWPIPSPSSCGERVRVRGSRSLRHLLLPLTPTLSHTWAEGERSRVGPVPDLSFLFVQALNGLASASSLFIIAAGLTIVFGVTRIVNFAHGSFYMLGAYFAVTIIPRLLDVSNS